MKDRNIEMEWYRSSIVICLMAILGVLIFLFWRDDTASRPWHSYATHKEKGTAEWWLTEYETYEDCRKDMEYQLTQINANWYRTPFGCAFRSNNYWKAKWMIFMHPNSNFICLSKSSSREAAEAKMTYSAALGKMVQGDG